MDYYDTSEGIVKKQMKFNSTSKEEVELIINNLEKEKYHNCKILTQIDNPNGRITFKDIRKINVGISKKDLLLNSSILVHFLLNSIKTIYFLNKK